MTDLSGKVALVTGAGQGVGQGIALALAAAGRESGGDRAHTWPSWKRPAR
jgi:NAD(P)-dependent dehydrogenase (short-subunit alcohol dehydrogenase family)